ncbi:hypothetical protein PAN31117_03051 [Pandoraea anapnoica]|uniref:HTH Mu-type domain-containing protein n=2 Tax=Burkholderiaceae TaxID=119060 RepID=A0A5E5A693_9BURK|nr:hypothetical protein PIN31009_02845 [Pandoraea iniqua]VVE68756.1 hypothetical protein PAN31117_03051 [Pandoraea anapnoica]
MKLPDLPTTKIGIAARAEREGWYSEEKTGLGGTRRVFRVPEQYFQGTSAEPGHERDQGRTEPARVDLDALRIATTALEQWLADRGQTLAPGKKAEIIAVLYDYVARGAEQGDMSRMLKALAA